MAEIVAAVYLAVAFAAVYLAVAVRCLCRALAQRERVAAGALPVSRVCVTAFAYRHETFPAAYISVDVLTTDDTTIGQAKQLADEALRLLVKAPDEWKRTT